MGPRSAVDSKRIQNRRGTNNGTFEAQTGESLHVIIDLNVNGKIPYCGMSKIKRYSLEVNMLMLLTHTPDAE